MRADAPARLGGRELFEARTRRLSARCLVAETTPAGSANAGVVVGDDRVLVVDTRVTPSLGAELADAVREATGAAPHELVVVNTHFHGDHVFGNGAFAGAPILASRLTQAAQRREWAHQQETFRGLRPHQADDIDRATPAPATVGFDAAARVELGGVSVELEPVGPAHTPGDLAVLVPAEGVAFVGDVVFHGHWPVMWDADVPGWLAALDALGRRDDVEVVVPGHGSAGGPALLSEMAACLRFLVALERDGGDEDEAIAASPFAGYLHRDRVAPARRRVREQFPAAAPAP